MQSSAGPNASTYDVNLEVILGVQMNVNGRGNNFRVFF